MLWPSLWRFCGVGLAALLLTVGPLTAHAAQEAPTAARQSFPFDDSDCGPPAERFQGHRHGSSRSAGR